MDGPLRYTHVSSRDLKHYGVKGMHWGVRRKERREARKAPGSADHERAQAAKAKIKTQGTKSLSNNEFEDLLKRMNLEQRYSKMMSEGGNSFSKGHNVIKDIMKVGKTTNDVIKFINSPAGKLVSEGFDKATGEAKKRARSKSKELILRR